MKPSSCRINNKMNPYQKIIIPVISSLIVVSWNDLVFTYSLSSIGSMAIILRKSWSRYAANMNLTSRFSRHRTWLRSGDCFGKGELLMEGPVLHPCWPVLKCSLEMNFHFCTSGLYGGFAHSDHHLTYDEQVRVQGNSRGNRGAMFFLPLPQFHWWNTKKTNKKNNVWHCPIAKWRLHMLQQRKLAKVIFNHCPIMNKLKWINRHRLFHTNSKQPISKLANYI